MDKAKIICDTDVIIDLITPTKTRHAETKSIFQNVMAPEIEICISVISIMELILGVKNKQDYHLVTRQINLFPTIHISEEISKLALQLVKEFYLSHSLLLADALIAATAIYFNSSLFTYNKKDFKYIPGIKLYES